MDASAPDVANSSWGHKYFHVLFPEKIDDFHASQFQRFYLIKLLETPPEGQGRYIASSRYFAVAAELNVPVCLLTKALGKTFGRPHYYWRIGTSDGTAKRNRWGMMRDGNLVAVGWPDIGDLTGTEYSGAGKENTRPTASRQRMRSSTSPILHKDITRPRSSSAPCSSVGSAICSPPGRGQLRTERGRPTPAPWCSGMSILRPVDSSANKMPAIDAGFSNYCS